MADQVRIGVLGAARIAPSAIVRPARKLPQVAVSASYDELLADPDLDAVYIRSPELRQIGHAYLRSGSCFFRPLGTACTSSFTRVLRRRASAAGSTGVLDVRRTGGQPGSKARNGVVVERNRAWFSPGQDSNATDSISQTVTAGKETLERRRGQKDRELKPIFNLLPNGLHCAWTLKALAAGKHVLCEKPFAANAAEAEQMAAAAEGSGKVLMEAFHYRYHPLGQRMKEVVTSGQLGTIRHIETWMCFPLPLFNDIRYQYDLAGGALMDAGCYAVNMLRWLAGTEPEVTSAQARLTSPQVDRCMRAEMRFADGSSGRITCSMWSTTFLRIGARVTGELGEMTVFNPVMPSLYHHLKIRTKAGTRTERFPRETTYYYQLRAFASAVLEGAPVLTTPADALANMRVTDAIYEKAGLWLRGRNEVAAPRV